MATFSKPAIAAVVACAACREIACRCEVSGVSTGLEVEASKAGLFAARQAVAVASNVYVNDAWWRSADDAVGNSEEEMLLFR